MPRRSQFLIGLLFCNAVSAVGGGLALMTGVVPEQSAWIRATDFPSLYAPGVILMAIVGGSAALAALAMAKRSPGWQLASLLSGTIMVCWIVGEIASMRTFHVLQAVYLATGILTIWLTPTHNPANDDLAS